MVSQIKGEMNYPTGIAIDGNNILYVSNNHFLSMFDTNGKFLGKFGKHSSGDAEFEFPYVVVVDETSDLYVCDKRNNCIGLVLCVLYSFLMYTVMFAVSKCDDY